MWGGASVPLEFGSDGRPLRNPWRMTAEMTVAEADRIRASRAQPLWPRLLGWTCIGVAGFVALLPMTWVSPRVQLSAASLPGPESPRPMIAISSLHYVSEAAAFRWVEGDILGAFSI